MGARERVQRSIESAVTAAERLLDSAPPGEESARLAILMTGWFRGIASALEELAVEIDELRANRDRTPQEQEAMSARDGIAAASKPPETQAGETVEASRAAAANLDEAALLAKAENSRQQTRELRGEARELEGSSHQPERE